jgi:PAS domain S-box-containing protein
VDATGDWIEVELQRGGMPRAQLWPQLDRMTARVPAVQVLAVFDAQGRQVCGEAPATRCRHLNVADRPYFLAARQQQGDEVRLVGPLASRLDGLPVLMLVRPLRATDGSFQGVVSALLPLAGLQGLLRATRPGDAGAVGLRTLDLQTLVREPPLPANVAASSPVSAQLRAALAASPEAGLYRAPTGGDGVDRISAYQRVRGWPVLVLVGSAADDVLATWRAAASVAALFLLVLAGGSLGLVRAHRRREAETLRAQHLFDTAPCGYHALDPQGRFASVNSTECEWLGVEATALLGQASPRDFFTPASQQVFDRNFPTLREQGRLDNLELELRSQDGRLRHVLVSAKARFDEQGRFVGSNSVMHDVTALREAQLQIRELARSQAAMLDTDLVGIARLKNRQIVWANRGMVRLLGYPAEAFVGMPMRQLYADQATFERVGAESYPLLRSGRFHRVEVPLRQQDGQLRWMDAGGAPLTDDASEVLMTLADLSDRKAAEALRLRSVELQAQNAQLVETSRLHDEFLANMSHELRTPLNGILGCAQLAQLAAGRGDAPAQQRHIAQILASGQHLLGLVQAQLDFASVEAGRMSFEPQAVPLPALVDDTLAVFAPLAQAHQVWLHSEVLPGLPPVWADPARLRQVLALLVDNAVKFSRPGGHVQVRHLAEVAGDGDEPAWGLVVADEGLGIAEADHDKVFQKFTQLSAGSTKAYGGAGMGLALARQLARAMGGDVTLSSRLGEGAVFTLVLPARSVRA